MRLPQKGKGSRRRFGGSPFSASEVELLEIALHVGDLGIAVLEPEEAQAVAGLFIVEPLEHGAVLECFGVGLLGFVGHGDAADADPLHLLVHGAELHVGVGHGLAIGLLLLAHADVELAVQLHEEAEGAYAGLVPVHGGVEERTGVLQEFKQFFHDNNSFTI